MFWFGPSRLITQGFSVHQFIDAMIKEMYPVRCVFPYLLKNRLVFGPYRPEKEICYCNKNGKFKFQTDIDRHGPRSLLTHRHLAEPPPFSLYTTLNKLFWAAHSFYMLQITCILLAMSMANFREKNAFLLFTLSWVKGIAQPFELGAETRLIRSAVKYYTVIPPLKNNNNVTLM